MLKILHLLTSGGIGGIEVLCRDIAAYSNCENHFCFLFGEGSIYEQMKASGYNVYSMHNNKKLSILKFNMLKRKAEICDIIVVHHDDPFLQMYYLAIMKAFPKKKYISMVHHCYDPVADNLGYGFMKKKIKHFITSKMFIKSSQIIFVSKAGKESYTDSFRFDDIKSYVIYNGISRKFLLAGQDVEKKTTNTIRLLYVGRLVELKGVNTLIDVLPKIDSQYSVKVDIVGDGKCRCELEEKVKVLGLKDKVMFHGFQKDVTSYLEDADIFVYPSKTEIFGISLVEAMAFKCICVANNVGGIPEIIKDGINGFLNTDNTSEGLEKAINRAIGIMLDSRKRINVMNAARNTAERFTIENTVANLEKVYKSEIEK